MPWPQIGASLRQRSTAIRPSASRTRLDDARAARNPDTASLTVWETQPARRGGATGYAVIPPDEDTRKDYRAIYDVSGDGAILNGLISRLAPGGEVVLAGFYKNELAFAFAPAFMREAQIRVAAQWKKHDLLAVTALVERGALSLDGLITHTFDLARAREAYEVAFGDPQCLKMMLDWRA